MKVNRLGFRDYRNLKENELIPGPQVNVICGDNAQGKTNLLEAVWLFTGGRSFRGARDQELIAFSSQAGAVLALDFEAEEREQTAKITIGRGAKKRAAQLNGVDQPAASSLIGKFCAVVFSPDHLSLVKEGPSMRRKFLDAALCQRKPAYARLLSQYSRTLAQRNTLLKDISYHSELLETLEIWDEKLSGLGAAITIERKRYLERLSEAAGEIYDGISQGRERFAVRYDSGLLRDGGEEAGYRERLFSLLQNGRKEDLNAGFTTKGPHRDDLEITLGGLSARMYGSQGQQRSAVLALKLAEAQALAELSGETPLVLLDDVMSELDQSRQDYLLNHLHGRQVFLTCCSPETVRLQETGLRFRVEAGQVFPEQVGEA